MKGLVTPAALIAVLVCAATALAHGSAVRVSGVQAPPDTTAGAPGDPCAAVDPVTGLAPVLSNAMAGSLIGCWYTDTFNLINNTPDGVIVATGTENFVGCLDIGRNGRCAHSDPTGSLALTYRFEGKFDPVTGKEIAGRCQHKIVSGTGGFTGATGRINFHDNVTNGTSNYRGHITLADSHSGALAKPAAPNARSRPAGRLGAPVETAFAQSGSAAICRHERCPRHVRDGLRPGRSRRPKMGGTTHGPWSRDSPLLPGDADDQVAAPATGGGAAPCDGQAMSLVARRDSAEPPWSRGWLTG